ncbi:MAG: shikimate dehydrogenase, partial [Thermoplasmatota archaeon]
AASVDADLVEVRLDALAWLDEAAVRRLGSALGRRAIATLRPVWEGGAFRGDETDRERWLGLAINAGFAFVDVEARAPFADAFAKRARLILSRHLTDAMPSEADALEFVREAHRRGAWCAKLAVHFASPGDASVLARVAVASRDEGLRAALMAVNDAAFRFAAPLFGLALVYAAPDERSRAAPGQPLASDLRSALRLRVPSPLGTGSTARLVFLFGDPVAHSASPRFQNAAFSAAGVDARYVAARVPASALPAAVASLRALDALGANVTIPHKIAVLPLVDALDASAREAGAVNTIVHRGGRLFGHNTDAAGALDALADAGFAFEGRALVLGAGGTGRALAGALAARGMEVDIVNRTPRKGARPWAEREALAKSASLVVNATSVGLGPDDPSPLRADAIEKRHALLDAPYVARGETALVRAARSRHCQVIVPGKEMLLAQGARSFELWTGRAPDLHVMRSALQ